MRRLTSIIAVSALFLAFTSCGGDSKKKEEKNTQSFIEEVKANYGEQNNLVRVVFLAEEALDSPLEKAEMFYKKDEQVFVQKFVAGKGVEWDKIEQHPALYSSKPVGLDAFKINNMSNDYDRCLAYLKENFTGEDELDNYTLYSWEAETNMKGEVDVRVHVNATLKSEGKHREGRVVVTNYYEFTFDILHDGTFRYRE